MLIYYYHISDIHLVNEEQIDTIYVEKMVSVLNSFPKADEYRILISGDLAHAGTAEQYTFFEVLIDRLRKCIKKVTGNDVMVYAVPGNHDIDFSEHSIDLGEVKKCVEIDATSNLVQKYFEGMDNFFSFAKKYGWDSESNKSVSVVRECFGDNSIGIVMVNSAPFSLLGGTSDDMGYHYLSEDSLNKLEEAGNSDFNILMMHHSIEWFRADVKSRLRRIISEKYNLIITGHEHEPVGEERRINDNFSTELIQGNALYGNNDGENGFCLIRIDTEEKTVKGESYKYRHGFYSREKILDCGYFINKGKRLCPKNEFIESIVKDARGKKYDDYYTFPGVEFKNLKSGNKTSSWETDSEDGLCDMLTKHKCVNICGGRKSGKTLLAARMYRMLVNKDKYPLLICADDIRKKQIDKTTKREFEEQYEEREDAFELFTQLDLQDRIVLLDDASRIEINTLNGLIDHFEKYFGHIILFSEEVINLDIKTQVIDAVNNEKIHITIKPFYYIKRFKLIQRILLHKGVDDNNVNRKARDINDMINAQIKYFDLNPEFIINFVDNYEKECETNIGFAAGINVFSMVYENAIKTRIIENSVDNISPALVVNVLRELAYHMHFSKKSFVSVLCFDKIVDNYNSEYRQNVNPRVALNVAITSKILKENENEIYFNDRTLLAYFVALAISFKMHNGEEINADIQYLLKYLCFGINSDVVLFLALVTNNPKILNIIINGARSHFLKRDELSFDKNNISFIARASVKTKDTAPTDEERVQRQKNIEEQEKETKPKDIVELIDEYNYSELELGNKKNQLMISIKYLEVLSKILPAFCQDMKVIQQDELVSLLYQCPNKFLYMLFEDVEKNFDTFCNELYSKIAELKREKRQVEDNQVDIKRTISEVAANLVLALYQLVAMASSSTQSIKALNAFDYENNSNYRLQNLMMCARVDGLVAFSKKAKNIDRKASKELERQMIKYTVRDYLMRNNVELHGEAESLMAYFFENNEIKKMKDSQIKKRVIEDKSEAFLRND